jgi:hypothetical protein
MQLEGEGASERQTKSPPCSSLPPNLDAAAGYLLAKTNRSLPRLGKGLLTVFHRHHPRPNLRLTLTITHPGCAL